jgi:MarR family transcriptional regulator for hemolysin
MLPYDFEASVGYWIFSTAHELSQKLNEQLAEHGITYRQWEVLVWLSFAGECSQNELAARMLIEAPTLVGVLDRMERDGWIQRVPDAADRRRKLIRPTAQVESVWAKMVGCALSVRQQATAGIAEEDLQTVREVLAKMRRNLSGEQVVDRLAQQEMIKCD